MNSPLKTLAILLFTGALPAAAGPAGGGGGVGGRGFLDDTEAVTPTWRYNLESALGRQRPVLLYVHPVVETGTPSFLRLPDIARASRDAFVFVRMPFKPGEPLFKDLNVTGAPTVLVLDTYGNEWRRAATLSQNSIKDLLRFVPEEIARYIETLDRSLGQAKSREEKGDDRGALLIYKRIAAETKKGYEQIAAAREKLRQLGDKRLADAVALLSGNERGGLQELEGLAREYADTPLGARARLALLAHGIEEASDLKARIAEIQKLSGLDGEEYAAVAKESKEMLDALEVYGGTLVEHALRKAKRGDAESARAILRRVSSDFAGTKAARQAGEELAKL